MLRAIATSLVALALSTSAAHASDRICDYLRAFERAPFEVDSTGKPQFRWIDFHWYGNWMDFDKGWQMACQPSDSNASRAFCNWLQENSSFEFAEYLPMRILFCRGYPIRKFFGLGSQIDLATFDFFEPTVGQYVLHIDLRSRKKPDMAIRLAIFPKQKDIWTEKRMPPLFEADNPVIESKDF